MKTLTLLFLTLLTLPVFGQTQPTFKATLRWMHNTADYEAGHISPDGGFNSTEVPLTNTCRDFVIIQTQDTSGLKDGHKSIDTTRLDLSTIDPTTVDATPVKGKPWSYVDIDTTDDADTIQSTLVFDGETRHVTKTAGVSLRFDGTDFAPRFAKALKHAVILCGGKPSAF